MSVTDIVSNMELSIYPIVALVLFLTAFGIIGWRALSKPRALSEHEAMLPLLDDDGEASAYNTPNGKGVSRG
ncbi:MAG: hypothetical protein KC996_11350 [Phycisphaerales bacterium]|nr:hypothetical protein [Phycisphaerales bacterium]